MLDFKAWWSHAKIIIAYFSNPFYAAHEIFKAKGALRIEGILLCLLIAIILLAGMIKLKKRKEPVGMVVLNSFLFLLTLFLMTISSRTWAMHHVVLSLPFLLLALFHVYSRLANHKAIIVLFLSLLIVNAGLYARLPMLPINDFVHPAMMKINTMLNERFSEKYLLIFLCEELYYSKVLFKGNKQRVIYPGNYWDASRIGEIKKVLVRLSRKPLFIARNDNDLALQMIRTDFPECSQLKTNFDPGIWVIWCEK